MLEGTFIVDDSSYSSLEDNGNSKKKSDEHGISDHKFKDKEYYTLYTLEYSFFSLFSLLDPCLRIIIRYSGTIGSISFLLSLLLCLNQALYIYDHLILAKEVNYYLSVDMAPFDQNLAINDAETYDSFRTLVYSTTNTNSIEGDETKYR